jgi:hypothetical protein
LLDGTVVVTPFEAAASIVRRWLDGDGAAFAKRSPKPNRRIKMDAWDIEMDHPTVGRQSVQLTILPDFPVTPPQIHFDPTLCLVWPHIEEDGKFCHGVEPAPGDFTAPVQVVEDVLERLSQFWIDTQNQAWIDAEFQAERLSYWLRFCLKRHQELGVQPPGAVRVVMQPLAKVIEGTVAGYFPKGQAGGTSVLVVTPGNHDPHLLAQRHRWDFGTLTRGSALYVPIPEGTRWTPKVWPTDFAGLAALVDYLADEPGLFMKWVARVRDSKNKQQSLTVIFAESTVCYGYLISPSVLDRLLPPRVTPFKTERVDADWALARDAGLPRIHRRREKRVLLLGCGSLGSPVAELLARAGVGTIDIVDKETLESANCARHLLGASKIGQSKADLVGQRLTTLVPEVKINAHHATVTHWLVGDSETGVYDLVVDCTGESTTRTLLSHYRDSLLGECSTVFAWMEPFCAAAHVVHVGAKDAWPSDDPVEKVNVASWERNGLVPLPACSSGFSPYGAADAWQAAGFVTERLLSILDKQTAGSQIWSWVRASVFFDRTGAVSRLSDLVPQSTDLFHSIQISRDFAETVRHA